MHGYFLLLLSFVLLAFIFIVRSGFRKKIIRKSWIERLETMARDNRLLWSTSLPYSQKEKLYRELDVFFKRFSAKDLSFKLSEKGGWAFPINLLEYSSVKRLFTKLLPSIVAYSQTLGLDSNYLTLTAKVENPSAGEESSVNDNALFSGTYFLKAEGDEEDSLSFYKKERAFALLARFYPQVGDLFLFPSDMQQEMTSKHEKSSFMRISFDVHFGNRKKSWLISKVLEAKKESLEDVVEDPYYEKSSEENYLKKEKSFQFFHISKIKNKFNGFFIKK